MISLSAPIHPNPDVVSTLLDNGEVVLMHMGTASYFTLNATGAQIWAGLDQGLAPSAIVDQLVATYAVETVQATASVQALLTQLAEQQLVLAVEAL
jgi:hypothetical protein